MKNKKDIFNLVTPLISPRKISIFHEKIKVSKHGNVNRSAQTSKRIVSCLQVLLESDQQIPSLLLLLSSHKASALQITWQTDSEVALLSFIFSSLEKRGAALGK